MGAEMAVVGHVIGLNYNYSSSIYVAPRYTLLTVLISRCIKHPVSEPGRLGQGPSTMRSLTSSLRIIKRDIFRSQMRGMGLGHFRI